MKRDEVAFYVRLGADELEEVLHVAARAGGAAAIDDGGTAKPDRMACADDGLRGRAVKVEILRIVAAAPERRPVGLVPYLEFPVAHRGRKARIGGELIKEAPHQLFPARKRLRWGRGMRGHRLGKKVEHDEGCEPACGQRGE